MIRLITLIALLILQDGNDPVKEIMDQRAELDAEFRDPDTTPLTRDGLREFTGLHYFPIDLTYRVRAKFERINNPKTIRLPTTTDRKPEYKEYGMLHFVLEGKELTLTTYLNEEIQKQEEYKDYLFLPFLDRTNGESTYGGGRYLDFRMPESDSVYIDFNKAYNPYCCYSDRYSCPLVPRKNYLPVEIRAGVMNYHLK